MYVTDNMVLTQKTKLLSVNQWRHFIKVYFKLKGEWVTQCAYVAQPDQYFDLLEKELLHLGLCTTGKVAS